MKTLHSLVALALMAIVSLASAAEGLVVVKSPYGVLATMDRFEKVVKERGLTVFARIDHAAGAAKIGKSLRATEVIIFGNQHRHCEEAQPTRQSRGLAFRVVRMSMSLRREIVRGWNWIATSAAPPRNDVRGWCGAAARAVRKHRLRSTKAGRSTGEKTRCTPPCRFSRPPLSRL
jgi:hypothetical protein